MTERLTRHEKQAIRRLIRSQRRRFARKEVAAGKPKSYFRCDTKLICSMTISAARTMDDISIPGYPERIPVEEAIYIGRHL